MDTPREWLEADGLGGFASGTEDGIRTRRYHALLLAATTPPTGRMVLVNGCEVSACTATGEHSLSAQRYGGDVVHPDGARWIESFQVDPWPTWVYRLADGTRIRQEIFVAKGAALTAMSWRLLEPKDGVELVVRPLLSGRDYHALHFENPSFRFDPEPSEHSVTFAPYDGVPKICMLHNGRYQHAPDWYRNFLYNDERDRGLDQREDLASPGALRFTLGAQPAVLVLGSSQNGNPFANCATPLLYLDGLKARELRRRRGLGSALERAADDYLVRRGKGSTLVAGYPWFTDWGRDTFIAMRGLCLATGQLAPARDILLEWAGAVSQGMLPNRFPDGAGEPEFNSVDAALWFVVAVHELLQLDQPQRIVTNSQRRILQAAIEAILEGYAKGTRHGIVLDHDGLLKAGEARCGTWGPWGHGTSTSSTS
jgi:predicted glycogen debranching enzyme